MSAEVEVGSVVRLKSGGPKMTVSEIGEQSLGSGTKYVWCDWFVQDKAPWKKDSGSFPLTSVELVKQGSSETKTVGGMW
jgi:uncharacterized protein YodC (DUF2158 family)